MGLDSEESKSEETKVKSKSKPQERFKKEVTSSASSSSSTSTSPSSKISTENAAPVVQNDAEINVRMLKVSLEIWKKRLQRFLEENDDSEQIQHAKNKIQELTEKINSLDKLISIPF